VLEDESGEQPMQLHRPPHRTDRQMRMLDVGRHRFQRRIARRPGDVIDRDRIPREADFPARKRFVVARVEPEKRAGYERRVQSLAYSSAASVSLELMTTRLFWSTRLAPWLQSTHWHQE
jgi:hypothetical protein